MSDLDVEGEVLAEEDVLPGEADGAARPLPLPHEPAGLPVLGENVRTAVLAAAGGALAGAATVAAVRAVAAVGSRARPGRLLRRRERPKIVATRSFMVDVHLLGR